MLFWGKKLSSNLIWINWTLQNYTPQHQRLCLQRSFAFKTMGKVCFCFVFFLTGWWIHGFPNYSLNFFVCTLKFSLITSPLKGTGNTGGKDTHGKTAKINSHRYISTHCVLDWAKEHRVETRPCSPRNSPFGWSDRCFLRTGGLPPLPTPSPKIFVLKSKLPMW